MPNLPDIPGKNLIEGTTKRALALAGDVGGGVLAVGGFVVKRMLGGRDEDERSEPGFVATPTAVAPGAGSGATDGVPPAVPTGEGRRLATQPEPPPEPKAGKPKPAVAPKDPKPAQPPTPKAGKPRPATPKAGKPRPAPPKAAKPEPAKTAKPAKPKPPKAKPKAEKPRQPKPKATKPKPPPGTEPGDQRGGKDPHHALNNPVTDPDETEYPDPFDKREDPRDPVDPDGLPFGDEPHPPTGAESTSEPPPALDPEVGDRAKPPRRENLDD